MDHFERAGFGFGRKILLHVDLAERFAESPVGGLSAAFPARLNFLGAGQRLAAEVELFGDKFLWKRLRGGVEQVPAQINLPIIERRGR